MNRIIIILLVIILLIGCKTNPKSVIIKGDLYYTWLKFGNFYGQPDSLLTEFNRLKDSIGYEGLMKEDSVGTVYVKILEENDILNCPYIYIRTDEGKSVLLYLGKEDYKEFSNFTYKELINNKQKVRIEVKADSLVENMYKCRSLISVKVIEGETFQRQKKFKIEDYR